MSILALYYRVGSGQRGLHWIVQGRAVCVTAGVMTAFSIATFLVSPLPIMPIWATDAPQTQLFACTPVSLAWDVEHILGGCINGTIFMQVTAAINVVTDVVLLLFPLPLLPLLKFNKPQRSTFHLKPTINKQD
jgi:hypothetical protein